MKWLLLMCPIKLPANLVLRIDMNYLCIEESKYLSNKIKKKTKKKNMDGWNTINRTAGVNLLIISYASIYLFKFNRR